jgi:GMP synthase (glutamine-hydrolysing)
MAGDPARLLAAMRILSVLHPGGGHSGVLGERARAAGHAVVEWTPGAGEPIPGPLSAHDALAVFGGGMNLSDLDRLPWLRGEIELLRDAIARAMPVIGVCLGAQLLAAAAGAEVHRASEPEIGWHEVELTPAAAQDPVLGRLPARFTACQWHSYAFELPAGAVELARSPVCPQAFRLAGPAWGVQFHPEVTEGILRAWIEDFDSDPDAVRLGVEPTAAMAQALARLPEWNELGAVLFDGFLEAALRARAAAARARVPAAAPSAAPAPPLLRG